MIEEIEKTTITEMLRCWYRGNARQLPWRETQDPYAIWISEVMLQQTRVETVIPYFNRWMAEFPGLDELAAADEDQVLKAWEGLGYYSRARNIHHAAQIIVEKYGGSMPQDLKALQHLPGIGRYTAGAIASIAFNDPAPILDGNLRRVFSRLFNIQSPIRKAETERQLWEISSSLVPDQDPGEFNQALMELGALICLPKNPACSLCPLAENCQARELGIQDSLPIRIEKKPLPHHHVAAAVIENQGQVLLAKRPPGGLLGGLWEFPGGKQEEGETLTAALRRELQEELNMEIEIGESLGNYQHAYTHYRITLHAFYCRRISEKFDLKYHTDATWVAMDELDSYPMGKIDRLIANHLQENPELSG